MVGGGGGVRSGAGEGGRREARVFGGAARRAHRRFVALLALGLGVCEELLAVRALVEGRSLVADQRVELVCVQSGLQEGGSGGGEVEWGRRRGR